MAYEPNIRARVDEARQLLDAQSLDECAQGLARTAISLDEECEHLSEDRARLRDKINRLSTANIDLLDTLRAVARACTLPEDTAPASLPAQVEDCLRDLSGQIERLTGERDNAVAKAQQLARVLADAATPEDAVQLLSSVLVEDAASAPNCAEWRGSYSGREFAITVQWVDGKSPHALIDEARRERDDLRTQLDAATAALDSERTVSRETAELRSLRQREIAALLPDDPAVWSSVDIASALVMARQEIARLRTATVPGALQAAMEALVPLASRAYRRCVGGIEPVDAPVTRATGGARDRPHLCLARHLSEDDARPWQAWLAGCDESLVTGATGDDHATADAALADLREALVQAAEPSLVRWGDEGTMDHDADDDTEGDACG